MAESSGKMDAVSASNLFAEVGKLLNANRPLPWNLSADAIREAFSQGNSPDARKFIDEHLLRVISNMTQFSPSKIGPVEKKFIEESLAITLRIAVKSLPDNPNVLYVLGRIFDARIPFYYGFKSGYSISAGYPQVRVLNARKFAEFKGFLKFVEVLKRPDCPWVGCDVLLNILQLAHSMETYHSIDDKTREVMALICMDKLSQLPDELAKKESTDSLSGLIQCICLVLNTLPTKAAYQERFFLFWFTCVEKYINSSSIVVRLFGWDQLAEIIHDVQLNRPHAASYTVQGAGTSILNGTYIAGTRTTELDLFQYTKPGNTTASIPLLTLFRCNMRNSKSKWWFLSHADIERPGTDKDVDYYLHRSTTDEEREPPRGGWTNAHTGMTLHGLSPVPLLRRGSPILLKGQTKEDAIDYKFLRWCSERDLLASAFNGSMMHKETISRTSRLLFFMMEYEQLSIAKLQEIWLMALRSRDMDVVGETFTILVNLLGTVTDDMFSALIDLATREASVEENFVKVAMFAEKFAVDDYKPISVIRSPELLTYFLIFLWNLYLDEKFNSLPNVGVLQDLISFCFRQKGGLEVVMNKMEESKLILARDLAIAREHPDDEKIEDRITKTLRTLTFLVSKNSSTDFDTADLEIMDVSSEIIKEIYRFLDTNRVKYAQQEGGIWYLDQLRHRFYVLRKYLLFTTVRDISTVIDLWNAVVDYPQEFNEFCLFLKGDTSLAYDSIFSKEDSLRIFDKILCSERVDWSQCGEAAFECFKTYFIQLESWSNYLVTQELPPKRGLSTLWTIVLKMASEQGHREAIDLLLSSYESFCVKDPNALQDFVQIVFAQLESRGSNLITGTELTPPEDVLAVARNIEVLNAALQKFNSGNSLAHAARGTMSRMTLAVSYRRISYHYNTHSHLDNSRFDKISDGNVRVDVHPLHTIKMLKAKIIDAANLGSSIALSFDNINRQLPDTAHVAELGLADGQELSVSYQVSFPQHNQSQYEDDIYGSYYGGRGVRGEGDDVNFCQLLTDDLAKFDFLISLCQSSEVLSDDIWRLLMTLPSQLNMVEMVRSAALPNDPEFDQGEVKVSWSDILLNSSIVRSTYLLQVLDYSLQPATEAEDNSMNYDAFRLFFLNTDGLKVILEVFLSAPEGGEEINYNRLAVCLHIMHNLLFTVPNNNSEDGLESPSTQTNVQQSAMLSSISEQEMEKLVDKLLFVARSAAAKEDSVVVHGALVVITAVISSPSAARRLIENSYSQALLSTVFKNNAKKVRELAADFAIQVGKSQPVVVSWLLNELQAIDYADGLCSDLFRALSILMIAVSTHRLAESYRSRLAAIISDKLMNYPKKRLMEQPDRPALLGFLDLLDHLVEFDPQIIFQTPFGEEMVPSLLDHFLFALEDGEDSQAAACDTHTTRHVAFAVLSKVLNRLPSFYEDVLSNLTRLSKLAGKQMRMSWGLQVSHDIKRPEIDFIGLKNQGCTCYSNSLLQVLFMNPRFRDALLSTPLHAAHRTSLWHIDDIDLVGRNLMFEWSGGEWRKGQIVGFDADMHTHRVQYERLDGSLEELAIFNIHDGRAHRETGRVKLLQLEGKEVPEVSEREEAAYRVLEQMQRTFCFLLHSKKKYFDPRPLIDACKTLNLSFNVYHQNDASEFCDQLLDRIETAAKGKHTAVDTWSEVFLRDVFGGKILNQKIPQDCGAFTKNKDDCGLWRSPRLESYLKIELMIRGKEKIENSLDGFVQGELMDGDNKIQCEVCADKKAAVMRSCIGNLPNVLLLHLKRFDLDFTTFETVKLNTKMSFPMAINMLKYTKDGIDSGANDMEGDQGPPIDPEDYEYELQGILVHAGVAQGGHYYSFVRGVEENKDKWYKFDDEDVTPFDVDQIPAQCFGGPTTYTASNGMSMEEDRTANALMLLYNKKKALKHEHGDSLSASLDAIDLNSTAAASAAAAPTSPTYNSSDLVTGYQAFEREVKEANLQHTLICFLVDPELHHFVRSLISSVVEAKNRGEEISVPNSNETGEEFAARIVQFGVTFLLDIVLHFRERSAIRSFVAVIRDAFEAFPNTAFWFVHQIMSMQVCSWFADYLLFCSDMVARGTFVSLVVAAVHVIAPKELTVILDKHNSRSQNNAPPISDDVPVTAADLCTRLMNKVMEYSFKPATNFRTADDIFALIRDLASIPCLSYMMVHSGIISVLCYYIMPDLVPQMIRNHFDRMITQSGKQNTRLDYTIVLPNVFEAIAALIGVPQIRKVVLTQEKSFWDVELVPEAHDALTQIFHESSRNGYMETYDLNQYLERVMMSTGLKPAQAMVRSIMDRYAASDNRLYLDGFLNHQAEVAHSVPKNAWRDLHAFGYRNDLSRVKPRINNNSNIRHLPTLPSAPPTLSLNVGSDDFSEDVSATDEAKANESGLDLTIDEEEELPPLELREDSRQLLMNISFYESGLLTSQAAAKAIAQRICYRDEMASAHLIGQALSKLYAVATDHTWNHMAINLIHEFLRVLLDIKDGLVAFRLRQMLVGTPQALAFVILSERERQQTARAVDFNRNFVLERYVNFVQDFLNVSLFKDLLNKLALENSKVRRMRGMLKMKSSINLTFDQEWQAENTRIVMEGGGTDEVNGEYLYAGIRNNAGFYERYGIYKDKETRFTLYKCSLRNGGFQWFISITPPNVEPGTSQDIDFYYATAKHGDYMPPVQWFKMSQSNITRDPAPRLLYIAPQAFEDDSESDRESLMMVADDSMLGVNDSFNSTDL